VVELRDREAARDVIGEVERLGGGVASVEVAQRKGTRTLEIGAGFGHGERDAAIVRLSERERLVGAWWHAPS
jgi:hypothetical protein